MRFRRLHEDFGVEVIDFDVLTGTADDDIEELQRALDEHQLLLFRRGEKITPERQVEISSWFGPPADNAGDGQLWSVLRNEDPGGRRQLAFHSDFTYTDVPIKVISLHAIELPPASTTTSFVSSLHAWDTLPPDRQQLLSGMTLRHVYAPAYRENSLEYVADHPIRLPHPRTGRPVLLVTEHHAERIHEVDRDESDRLLAELFAHLYAPERVYVHQWELYDLLVWDNVALQHARREAADLADGPRAMQRVAMNEATFAELTARAWEQQRRRQLEGA